MEKMAEEKIKVVDIPVKVDVKSAAELEERIDKLLETGKTQLIFDFSANEYVSSAGLRVFLSSLKRVNKVEGKLALCGIKPGVAEVFDMVGFTALFEICHSQEEARLRIISLAEAAAKTRLEKKLRDGQKDAVASSYDLTGKAKAALDEKI